MRVGLRHAGPVGRITADLIACRTEEPYGDAEVHATRSLNAIIAGSGDITHSGGAKITSHISGSGNINAR